MMTKCHAASCIESWKGQRTLDKTEEEGIKPKL